jgi:CRP-like cAMP-binding protein
MVERALALVRRVSFFASLCEEEQLSVAKLMRPMSYAVGEHVFCQGTVPDGMYVVETGKVQLYARVADTRMDLVTCGPGNVLCESGLVERGGRLVSGEVMEPTVAWILDARSFDGLCSQAHPAAFTTLLAASRSLALTFRGVMQHFGALKGLEPETNADRGQPDSLETTSAGPADIPLMRVLPAFRDWTDEELNDFASRVRRVELKRGQRLLVENTHCDSLFIVVRGAVEVSTIRKGDKYRHGIRGPGGLAGAESFCDGVHQMMTVTVREKAILLELKRSEFDQLVAARSMAGIRVLNMICGALGLEFSSDCRHYVKILAQEDIQASSSMDAIRGASSVPST